MFYNKIETIINEVITIFFNKIPKNYPIADISALLAQNKSLDDYKTLQDKFHSNEKLSWLFIGDSITQGMTHTHKYLRFSSYFREYLSSLNQRYNDTVVNTAITGKTSEDYIDNYLCWVTDEMSDFVFICFGMNDCHENYIQKDRFVENLTFIIDDIRKHGCVPILQTPQFPRNRVSKLTEYTDEVRKIAIDKKVLLVDVFAYWRANRKLVPKLLSDDIHPNQYGHLLWFKLILAYLNICDDTSPVVRLKNEEVMLKDENENYDNTTYNEA